ncbi:MAG: hypothetical protein JJU10_09340 [Idiomarina sp.]|nr:hypothetical protein [Idiomarina sp.]
MTLFTRLLALAAFLPFATVAETYSVSATLSHQGAPFASPSAVVRSDTPAAIEVTGDQGFRLTLTLTDLDADQIKVNTSLESAFGSMAPEVTLRPGAPATVIIGDLGLTLLVQRNSQE